MTEITRCHVGIKTDTPCPFVATEPPPSYGTDEPTMCAYHAADQVLHDEIDKYGVGLDKVTEWLEYARENHLTVLAGGLERLETDYRERLNFFESVTDSFTAANKKVTIYTGK